MKKFKVIKARDIITPKSIIDCSYDEHHKDAGIIFRRMMSIEEFIDELDSEFGGFFEASFSGSFYYPNFNYWDMEEGSQFREAYHIDADSHTVKTIIEWFDNSKNANRVA